MKRTYDWDKWFRMPRFNLRKGMDYDCSSVSMAQMIRNAASKLGIGVQVLNPHDTLIMVTITKRGIHAKTRTKRR